MTSSLVLRTTTRWLVPAMLLGSIWILSRGHHSPGGGFVGGLVALSAYLLEAFAEGASVLRTRLRIAPEALLSGGLLLALGSAVCGPLRGRPWMTGAWFEARYFDVRVDLGTPLLFDMGVFLVVIGSGLAVFLPATSKTG